MRVLRLGFRAQTLVWRLGFRVEGEGFLGF